MKFFRSFSLIKNVNYNCIESKTFIYTGNTFIYFFKKTNESNVRGNCKHFVLQNKPYIYYVGETNSKYAIFLTSFARKSRKRREKRYF